MMDIISLFKLAVEKQASDIHILVGKPPILRIDGILNEIDDKPYTAVSAKEQIYSLISDLQKKAFEQDRELDFSYAMPNVGRFRVNIHFEREVTGLVARVVSTKIPTIDELNMPPVVKKLVQIRDGLILVTGPTGCGKSTTLAALVNEINETHNAHIVTLEDPIEFIFPPKKSIIRQRQLGSDMKSFQEGLKHVLRQDPNVIMVGEMRDLESIAAAITLAETGHLVLGTLHTLSASQTVDRIIDSFPPYQQSQIRVQVSITLRAIISQQLLRKINGGRVAAREILINNNAVANLIRESKIAQIKTVIQTSADEGMITMDNDLKRLVHEGLVNMEDAKSHMLNPSLVHTD
jgi:twitching motility protein PilT